MNRAPAKGCVWPVLAPAGAFVRAGAVLRGMRGLSRRRVSSQARAYFCSIVASLPARLSPREMCRTGTANEDFSTARRGVVFRLKRADVCTADAAICVRLKPAIWFSRCVLRLNHACHAFLLRCFMFDHACCLPHSAKQNGLRNVAFLFRRGARSPVARSRIVDMVIELCRFTSGLYVSLWRSRRRDEGTRETELAARRKNDFA